MKLKIEHVPFHDCYGLIDELKTPDTIVTNYNLEDGTIIDLHQFKIKVSEIYNTKVKCTIIDNKGVLGEGEKVHYKNAESCFYLQVNQKYNIRLDVYDAMESWELILYSNK